MLIHSPKELALILKSQRKRLGLTQTEVGDLVGLKQKTISAIENNPKGVKLNTIFRILSALDLDANLIPKNQNNDNKQWKDEW